MSEQSIQWREIPQGERWSLRGGPELEEAAAGALGAPLPARVGDTTFAPDGRLALRLGPDEWFLCGPESARDIFAHALPAALVGLAHSLVDVGHRERTIMVEGQQAGLALQSGIALNLDTLPPGRGCRTVFDTTPVVVLHTAPHTWRLEVWRSLADPIRGVLEAAATEIRLGV